MRQSDQRTLQVGGARWKGTKTKLDSEGEEEDVQEGVQEDVQEEPPADGVVIIMPRGPTPKVAAKRAPKWRKLTTSVLKQHGGVLPKKKLQARVLALAVERGARGGEEALAAAWMTVVDQSRKFVIEKRNVRLR